MRKNGLILRVKLAMQFIIHGQGNMRIMTCEKCGAMNIAPQENTAIYDKVPEELSGHNVRRIWREIDTCQRCGANVIERQYWIW